MTEVKENKKKNELEEKILEAADGGKPVWVGDRTKVYVLHADEVEKTRRKRVAEDPELRRATGGLDYTAEKVRPPKATRFYEVPDDDDGGFTIHVDKAGRVRPMGDLELRRATGGLDYTAEKVRPPKATRFYEVPDDDGGFTIHIDKADRVRPMGDLELRRATGGLDYTAEKVRPPKATRFYEVPEDDGGFTIHIDKADRVRPIGDLELRRATGGLDYTVEKVRPPKATRFFQIDDDDGGFKIQIEKADRVRPIGDLELRRATGGVRIHVGKSEVNPRGWRDLEEEAHPWV